MNYQHIWDKTLVEGEKVEYEFSVSSRFRKVYLIVWSIISLILLPAAGIGILTFLIALLYFAFYLQRANAYAFTKKRVLVHKGWLSTNAISVDFNQITDVTVVERFFDRLLTKTGSLAINTAGTTKHEIALKNIARPYEVKKKLDEIRK